MLEIIRRILSFDYYLPPIAAPTWIRRRFHWTRKFRIEFFFAVYDFWVGIFPSVSDHKTSGQAIYICYFPMLGIRISWCWH